MTQIKEGNNKKGGVNTAPTSDKPNITPPSRYQALSDDAISIINNRVTEFKSESEFEQGYIHIEFCNGIHAKSWGYINYRHKMSGASDGEIFFKNIEGLIEGLDKIIGLQKNMEI